MTTLATPPRIPDMVGGTPCMICGTGNPLAALQCRECSAPMALVHDAAGRSQAPAIISIIGVVMAR